MGSVGNAFSDVFGRYKSRIDKQKAQTDKQKQEAEAAKAKEDEEQQKRAKASAQDDLMQLIMSGLVGDHQLLNDKDMFIDDEWQDVDVYELHELQKKAKHWRTDYTEFTKQLRKKFSVSPFLTVNERRDAAEFLDHTEDSTGATRWRLSTLADVVVDLFSNRNIETAVDKIYGAFVHNQKQLANKVPAKMGPGAPTIQRILETAGSAINYVDRQLNAYIGALDRLENERVRAK